MNPEVKQLWIDALRSGKYVQGRQTLARYEDQTGEWNYCCLGVLCELARDNGVLVDMDDLVTEDDEMLRLYDAESELPPPIVLTWAGLNDNQGTFTWAYGSVTGTSSLVERNDGGSTFDQIASVIEQYF